MKKIIVGFLFVISTVNAFAAAYSGDGLKFNKDITILISPDPNYVDTNFSVFTKFFIFRSAMLQNTFDLRRRSTSFELREDYFSFQLSIPKEYAGRLGKIIIHQGQYEFLNSGEEISYVNYPEPRTVNLKFTLSKVNFEVFDIDGKEVLIYDPSKIQFSMMNFSPEDCEFKSNALKILKTAFPTEAVEYFSSK